MKGITARRRERGRRKRGTDQFRAMKIRAIGPTLI